MSYDTLVKSIESYGASQEDICRMVLGLERDRVPESVIVAPWWEPDVYTIDSACVEFLGRHATVRAWNLKSKDRDITYIKTGIGAPLMMDVVLALGLSRLKRRVARNVPNGCHSHKDMHMES